MRVFTLSVSLYLENYYSILIKMSIFETFGNKPSVIIDIGAAYTKCGFSAESGPFAIIPTEINKRLWSTLSSSETSSVRITDLNGKSDETIREALVEFLYHIFYKILNANSRERKVVIVESVLTPSRFRQALADVLFANFQVVSIAFVPSHMAALYTLGISKGLVVDLGYTDCQIMPVAENIPLANLCGFANLGAKAIHANIERLIRKYAHVTIGSGKRVAVSELQESLKLDEKILEDIKLRCCFVTPMSRIRQYYSELTSKKLPLETFTNIEFKFAPDCDYNLPENYTLHVPGFVREMALEFLFVDELDDKQTVQHLILDTILNSPIDLRKDLSQNIVLIGGTTMLFGFKHRLVEEINYLLEQSPIYSKSFHFKPFKYHQAPSHDNYTAWLGGAIFGSLENLDYYSIQNSKYKETQSLPDWFTLFPKPNDPAHQI